MCGLLTLKAQWSVVMNSQIGLKLEFSLFRGLVYLVPIYDEVISTVVEQRVAVKYYSRMEMVIKSHKELRVWRIWWPFSG